MEIKDYVKIFRLDQENFQFNRKEFLNQLGKDLLELCKSVEKHPSSVNPETGKIFYADFRKVVKYIEAKFNTLSRYSVKPLSSNLWKAFFATQVVPLRKLWYPDVQKHIEGLKNIPNGQDKKSSDHKKGNNGKGNN